MKEEKIIWLNSLRGIACIIVVIAHMLNFHPTIGIYTNGCGKIGVWCFMVLSAYLLYRPYCREKKQFGIREWGAFYVKRGMRILPVYLVVLVLAYIIGYFTEIKEVILHLLGIHGVGHLWYMPVIMKVYLIMPVFIIIKNKVKPVWNVIILIATMVLSAVLSPYRDYVENSTELRWYLPIFIMGMLLALIIETCRKWKMTDSQLYDIGVVLCILVGVSFIPYLREKIWGIAPSGWLQNKYLLYGILWSIIILCITFSRYMKRLLTKSKVLSYIGKISFSIYLIHFPLLVELNKRYTNTWKNGLITVVVSIILAILINKLLEEPLERVRKNKRLYR